MYVPSQLLKGFHRSSHEVLKLVLSLRLRVKATSHISGSRLTQACARMSICHVLRFLDKREVKVGNDLEIAQSESKSLCILRVPFI